MRSPQPPACSEEGLPALPPLTEERIARISKALGHPVRIKIVEQFEECRARTVQDIVANCTLAQSTVSEHLRILREAGVLFATKDGPRVWYCLRRSALQQYAAAVEDLSIDRMLIGAR